MSPAKTTPSVLVIGGGPGGSYAAAALAREGFNVTLLESAVFPRYHIGESLLPSCRQFLSFIDALDTVASHGFTVKPGGAVKLNQYMREGYTDFVTLDRENGAWNVIRSEFDDLLLHHAVKCGVDVRQGTRVTEILFADDCPSNRPVAVMWETKAGNTGRTSFDWLVDASGKAGLMSTRYLKNRRFNASLKNVACWGYWSGAGVYAPGTDRENAPWFEALADQTGWVWYIPLHDSTVSIGVVMNEEASKTKKALALVDNPFTTQTTFYLEQLQLAPGVIKLLGTGILSTAIRVAGDYSYSASHYAGPHYRIVGDAGAFIDPFFSSGVHLAFTGALSAAASIAASARGDCDEAKAATFHSAKIGTSYTRFLLVVLGVYKQIRAQRVPVLYDVDEHDFDRAFSLLRPVIQGAADVGQVLTEDEVQHTMDFCQHLFAPTNPRMYKEVAARIDPALLSADAPLLTPAAVDCLINCADDEARHVLKEVNARKPIHAMYNPDAQFKYEVLEGFRVRLVRGDLGLIRA